MRSQYQLIVPLAIQYLLKRAPILQRAALQVSSEELSEIRDIPKAAVVTDFSYRLVSGCQLLGGILQSVVAVAELKLGVGLFRNLTRKRLAPAKCLLKS